MDILFDPVQFERFYNCSLYDVEDIPTDQRSRPVLGALTIALGVVLECLYLPCLFAISRPQLIAQPCYKLMFFLGLVNVSEVLIAAIGGGFFAIQGAVFCSQPTLMFVTGALASGLYYTETSTSCILAFNRLLYFHKPALIEQFFAGRKTLLWLLIPITVTVIMGGFVQPVYLYNPLVNTWTQFPHLGYISNADPESANYYYNPMHQYFSCAIIFTLSSMYLSFIVVFVAMRKKALVTNKKDTSIFVQVFWISVLSTFCCLGYTFDRQISQLPAPVSSMVIPIYTYGYILYQGSPAVIYLLMNKAIRSQLGISNGSVTTAVRAQKGVTVVVVKPKSNIRVEPNKH